MKFMRRLGRTRLAALSILALFLVLAPLLSGAGQSRRTRLKLATDVPSRSVWGKALKGIGDEIKKKTDGQVSLKWYFGGVQGDERMVLRRVKVGRLHGGALVGQGVVDLAPDTLALNLPFLFRTREEAEFVFQKMAPDLEAQFRKKGYEVMAWSAIGFTYLFSKDKVETAADFRRTKPWQIESDPLSRNLFEALGTTAVSTSVANVLTALQSGLIRAVFSPPAVLVSLQWHSRIKYMVETRITYAFGASVIHKKHWDRISAENREIVKKIFRKRIAELNEVTYQQNNEAIEAVLKNGVIRTKLKPDTLATFHRAADVVAKKMAGKEFSQAALTKMRKVLAEYRSKLPVNTKKSAAQ